MNTKQRINLLVTVTLLSSASLAQVQGFRPANRTQTTTQQTTSGQATNIANNHRLQQIQTRIEGNSVLKNLPPSSTQGLLSIYFSNKTVQKTVDESIRITGIVNDSQTAEIELMKLEILAAVASDMDIYDPSIQPSLTDNNRYAQYMIAMLANKLEAHALSQDGKNKVKELLKELKMQISNIGTANARQALENALEGFNMDTGLGLTVSDLAEAARHEGGLTSLFKGDNDAQTMLIGLFNGSEVKVTVSANEARNILTLAQAQFAQLIDIAQHPQNAKMNDQTGAAIKAGKLNAADAFLNGNKLLERSEAALSVGKGKADKNLDSYDDLLSQLRDYGDIIDGNKAAGKTARFFKNGVGRFMPGSGFIAGKLDNVNDKELKKSSLKKKIELTRQALRDGMRTIQEDNQELNRLRAMAIDYAIDLEKDMARLKLVSDHIAEFIKENEKTRPELVQSIKIHIGQRVERELNSVVATIRILRNSVTQIDTTIMAGMSIINQTEVLEREIIPIMSITEATHSAIAAQEAQMLRAKATRTLLENRLLKLAEAQEKALKQAAELAGTSIIDPKKLNEIENRMQKARAQFATDMQKAYDKLKGTNEQLIKGHNDSNHDAINSGMATQVDGIINGSGQK